MAGWTKGDSTGMKSSSGMIYQLQFQGNINLWGTPTAKSAHRCPSDQIHVCQEGQLQPTPEHSTMASKQQLEYQTHQQLQCRSIILWRKLLSMAMGFGFIFVPYIGYISVKPRNHGISLRPKSAPTFWGVVIGWISERLWKALGCLGLHTFRLLPYWTHLYTFCLKGTLPKVRCLLKATVFCDIYWHRTPMPKPWKFSSRLLPTSNTSSQAQTIRRLWPNKCNLSGAVQWLTILLQLDSFISWGFPIKGMFTWKMALGWLKENTCHQLTIGWS